jgi:methyl-accepting chemotaxis protein
MAEAFLSGEANLVSTGFLVLALLAAAVFVRNCYGLKRQNIRLTFALTNMTQGLCVWDSSMRLLVCNDRYIDMYGMSRERVKPGVSITEVLRHRAEIGHFKGDIEKYVAAIRERVATQKASVHSVHLHDGRTISIAEQPLPDGSLVATHEDITQWQILEHQRADLAANEQRRERIDAAIATFNERIETLLRSVKDSTSTMKDTAEALFSSSDQTSQRAQGAVQASNEASVNVTTAATAADQMASSIDEISRQLAQTTAVVRQTVEEARATNDDIKGLAEAAQKIGDVVELIRNIAGQTNLLALNATIEAARAGESGRGFAVVASEVKSLAVQTAKATEDITAQILSVQASTSNTVEAIARITRRMQEIDTCASAVAAAVEEQNAVTQEISHNVTSAAQGTSDVVDVLDQVAGAAIGTRQSAETVLSAAASVEQAVGNLRTEVEDFLAKVAV